MSDSEKPKSWRERRQSIKHKWLWFFIVLKRLYELLSYWVQHWSFLNFLRNVECLTILVAVIFYIVGYHERKMQSKNLQLQVQHLESQLENQRKAKHYQAWQVINIAQGKSGGGGRKDALEDLHKDKVSLVGIDISKAHLPNLNLENAKLAFANLDGAILTDANMAQAFLGEANLTRATLQDANLTRATLLNANLAGAEFISANLSEAMLIKANLAGANLTDANLSEASFSLANLAGADLRDIKNWRDIRNIEYANIYDIKNAPKEFKEWATDPEQGAVIFEDEEEWKKFKSEKLEELLEETLKKFEREKIEEQTQQKQ
ncbi:MAG TPA: hypothetical protein DIU00_16400 [Phycisphaerales bacterium]|nr:hypothetical protein [Phycisphaerales bacterium]